jgi:ATP-dependent RNA helicase RhlE
MLQLLAPLASTSTSPAAHPVRALVLVPTRELAAQVEESVRTYGKYLPLRIAVVYGGIDIKPQIKALHVGVEIVVATPGRLIDHMEQKSINLSQVQILVLDEADRMLDMGFMPAIKRILGVLPAFRQNLLFSATFSEDIKRLASEFMRSPMMIEVARRNAPADLVTHQVYEIEAARKPALLAHLIRSREMQQVLIFVRMKRDADRLARQLQRDGLPAAAIHGDRSQGERTIALDEFKQGSSRILVATDVAARGIDIDQLPFVINYELPNTPEDYVHRIGRTGRAGTPGEAISLVCPEEMEYLAAIEKLLKREIPRQTAERFDSGSRGRDRGRESPSPRSPRSREPAAGSPREREAPPRSRPREERDDSRARPRTARETPAAPAIKHDPSFDFSKPYEPSTSATAVTDAQAPSPANKRARPVAALFRPKPKTPENE